MLVRWWNITRRGVEQNPNFIFVFGGNLRGITRGPHFKNVVYVPTKYMDGEAGAAFFSDRDYEHIIPTWELYFARLSQNLRAGKTMVMPQGGIGTGRSQLKTRAPRLFHMLQHKITILDGINRQLLAEASANRPAYAPS